MMSQMTFSYQPSPQSLSAWETALGLQDGSRLKLIAQVQEGLPVAAFDRFSQLTGLSREALARALDTSTRTIARRKEAGKPLDRTTSERLVRLAGLYARAAEVIGDERLARQWMQTPREAFAGKTPFEMAQTELGAREVEDLLLRVEHGVFY
jgi:putative toxin-antitoxin system antitoxin component (TIGR02293 family)